MTAEEILSQYANPVPHDKENHLYCYAIIRKDLEMPTGKLAAQAGHAYGDVLDHAREIAPERVKDYRNLEKGGSKVTLKARNQSQLINAYNAAKEAGLPATVVVDQGHILLPHFTGEPIITAIGIGPCTQSEVRHITKKFNCV